MNVIASVPNKVYVLLLASTHTESGLGWGHQTCICTPLCMSAEDLSKLLTTTALWDLA